jgi:Zn-finger nucleic acid-binding protein
MKCPTCAGENLLMGERAGVEIDYCPNCRGVWLERGKIDTIVSRSIGGYGDTPAASRPTAQEHEYAEPSRSHHADGGHDDHSSKPKKKSMFGDLLGGLGGD